MKRLPPVQLVLVAAVCALILGIYGRIATGRVSELGNTSASGAYYNLLVDGFRSGHLYLAKAPPPELALLADPYNPDTNADLRGAMFDAGRIHDLSYHQGRLYLYFGATPALLLFWPYAALTGNYLSHAQAVAVFASLGFLAGSALILAAWRRYFPTVSLAAPMCGVLALGLATGMPILLNRPDVWEVPIACGFALAMLSLCALWRAVHSQRVPAVWTFLASLTYGLAVAARPSLLFGGVMLVVPLVHAWTEWKGRTDRMRRIVRMTAAAVVPMAVVGIGLGLYNYQRFGSPLEFGNHYQLLDGRPEAAYFSPDFLWFNFRVYFLSPANWSTAFPYVHAITLPPPPPGQSGVDSPYGILFTMPFMLFALAAPSVWLGRTGSEDRPLRSLLAGVSAFLLPVAFTVCLFCGACLRYQLEFTPALALLGAFGLMGLEQVMGSSPGRRIALRTSCVLLLVFSTAFNLLAGIKLRAEFHSLRGSALAETGHAQEAIPVFEAATRLKPDLLDAQAGLIAAVDETGRFQDGAARFESALLSNPEHAEELYDWYAVELLKLKLYGATVALLESGLQRLPDSPRLHDNMGIALIQAGRAPEAPGHFESAVRLDPRFAAAHFHLASLLLQAGRTGEARTHLEQALQIDPALAPALELLQKLPPRQVPLR